jgi:hypothetical protein
MENIGALLIQRVATITGAQKTAQCLRHAVMIVHINTLVDIRKQIS